ncbi:ectoine utilization protein EutA [Pseudotabrizicola algicola]|uniref:Ectoine utilization protein EutA n=1 Tax=Pseudotabrizicola algicola TaxID=2709381 RepID=A0A6B3RHT5_9RHOB|nr:ectoine utilization protein EutA [Pseudotabrizicola algicola]NEX45597.1 ectoine utilization protein EutA [Pseudotabrizicola algicola]
MTEIRISERQPRLDPRPVAHRVGLVALSTDHTSEVDYARMLCPAGIGVYVNRIPFANPVTPETLRAMEGDLAEGAALILPGEDLDAVIYGCTSASVCIGDAAVRAQVALGKPGCPVVTPISGTLAGLRAMGARRISVLTPYTVETSRPMAAMFEAEGIAIDRFTCLNMEDDREMARIAPDDLVTLASDAAFAGSDALFVSCTAVRAAGVIDRIEAAAGLPALSSNYAAAWQVARLCGVTGPLAAGHLMTLAALP